MPDASALTVALLVGGLAGAMWAVHAASPFARRLRARPCQAAAWRQAFPGATQESLAAFLGLFGGAFALAPRAVGKLHPGDRILAIYRARYPSRWLPDALEFEMLAEALQRGHGLALAQVWRDDLTLGELFALVRAGRQGAASPPRAASPFDTPGPA